MRLTYTRGFIRSSNCAGLSRLVFIKQVYILYIKKPSQNGKFTLFVIDVSKPCPNHDTLTWQKCLISFLYLDLYVLGNDALISEGSFLQTNHLCVLIHIWTKGEIGAPLNRFKPSCKIFLLTVPRGACFVGHLCFSVLFCYAFMHVCLLMPCSHLLGKGWPFGSLLWCLIVTLSLSNWYPGSGVVLDCIDSWSWLSFLLCNHGTCVTLFQRI